MIKLSGSGTVKKYRSGSFSVDPGATPKAYTFQHNLGVIPNIVKVFYNDNPPGNNGIELPEVATWWVSPIYGWFLNNDESDYITTTQVKIKIYQMYGSVSGLAVIECIYIG